MTKSIAVIFHQKERKGDIPQFAIWHLAEIWKKEGIRVHFLFGANDYVPADLAILHVDLTTVPQEYSELATRYPLALNGNITNIRKSLISVNRIAPGDGYSGPVIVKSDLNFAGQPERKLLGSPISRLAFRLRCRLPSRVKKILGPVPHFRSSSDYTIYETLRSVPRDWFSRKDVVIEKFVPEIQDGLFCLRIYHFLGPRGVCMLWKSRDPIIKASSEIVKREPVAVHPGIVKLAARMGFDFGKFDYVIREGEPVLLDANKTPGAANTAAFSAICPEWAAGIHVYL